MSWRKHSIKPANLAKRRLSGCQPAAASNRNRPAREEQPENLATLHRQKTTDHSYEAAKTNKLTAISQAGLKKTSSLRREQDTTDLNSKCHHGWGLSPPLSASVIRLSRQPVTSHRTACPFSRQPGQMELHSSRSCMTAWWCCRGQCNWSQLVPRAASMAVNGDGEAHQQMHIASSSLHSLLL